MFEPEHIRTFRNMVDSMIQDHHALRAHRMLIIDLWEYVWEIIESPPLTDEDFETANERYSKMFERVKLVRKEHEHLESVREAPKAG